MTGVPESGAVENALGNRVGDHCTRPSADDIGDGPANRGQGRSRGGIVRLARPCRCRMASGHDRQCVGECTEYIFGANVGELDLEPESLRPVTEEVTVAEQVEWGELQLIAAQPRLDGDIGPDTGGLARC